MFIVFEGTDGSGKATQVERAVKALISDGHAVELIDLPQYGTKSAGPVEEYLSGKYGGLEEISPYAASILYAMDRFDASFRIRSALTAGKIVLANRYVPSNAAHQGAKLADTAEREKFLKWLEGLEYGILNLPRPDLIIFLHVPAEIGYELVLKKAQRAHLNGKSRDIHEADLDYLKAVEQNYLMLADKNPSWHIIECAPTGTLLSIEEINKLVIQAIRTIL